MIKTARQLNLGDQFRDANKIARIIGTRKGESEVEVLLEDGSRILCGKPDEPLFEMVPRAVHTYKVISYEVWGNARDGFEVNRTYTTSFEVDLAEDATDKDIARALWRCGFASRGILTACISTEGDDYTIYVNHTAQSVGGYKPFCELRKIEG